MEINVVPRTSNWQQASNLRQIPVLVCTSSQIFTGYAYSVHKQRLLDALNEGFTVNNAKLGVNFLPLSDVEVYLPDGTKGKMIFTYIRKSRILFVAERTQSESQIPLAQTYPYSAKKKSVDVKVSLPSYTLVGKMHNDLYSLLVDTLERNDNFLPITNVEISPPVACDESKFDFVAVRADQVMYISEL
jgi:hypothetical protein